jgi:imidazolonepropionase-like amidohydrolase
LKTRPWRLTALLALAALVASGATAASEKTSPHFVAIVGASVVHPERTLKLATEKDQTVLIEGNRIRQVGPSKDVEVPEGATVIEAQGHWVIPGLIDAHVHFFQSGNLYTRPDAVDLRKWRPYDQEVARNKARLPETFKVWLASGVTGVLDIGGPFWNFDVRAAARASPAAPRVAVAGPLISMIDRPELDLGDPPIIRTDSPEAARKLVQRELERNPDYIKVWFIHRPGDDLAKQAKIVKAAADAAHAAGVPLAVHATELLVAKEALRAGADLLVHSVFDEPIDEEFIGLMRERGALYCPTLFVMNGYRYAFADVWEATEEERRLADPQILRSMDDLEEIPEEMLPQGIRALMKAGKPPEMPAVAIANLRTVWAADIPVVMGTDAGNIGTLHGPSVFREMAYLQQAGLTPLEVLRTATSHGARALRMEKELGDIEPGRLADLVILQADPLADVKNLATAHRVIKDGVVYDPEALMKSVSAGEPP